MRGSAKKITRLLQQDQKEMLAPFPQQSQVVAEQLGKRSEQANAKNAAGFRKLGLPLILSIADYAGIWFIGSWARTCRFLYVRLSLSLDGIPTPAVHQLSSVNLLEAPNELDCRTKETLFTRAQQILSVQCHFDNLLTLPGTLTDLNLEWQDKSLWTVLEAVSVCKRLRKLRLCDGGDTDRRLKCSPPSTMRWPELRYLTLDGVSNTLVLFVLQCVPAVEEVRLVSINLKPAPVYFRLAHLCKITMQEVSLHSHHFPLFTVPSLTEMELTYRDSSTLVALSPTLHKLMLNHIDYRSFGNAQFGGLRWLVVKSQTDDNNAEFLKALSAARLPQLQTLEFEGPQTYALPSVVLLCDMPRSAVLPQLSSLHLVFVNIHHCQLPSHSEMLQWQRFLQSGCADSLSRIVQRAPMVTVTVKATRYCALWRELHGDRPMYSVFP